MPLPSLDSDMFYELSEGLIGVCRDVGMGASRTLTLDLTQFDTEGNTSGEKRGAAEDIGSEGKRARAGITA